MEFVMKQGQAPAHGQLGQGHGPLKRTGTVTFLVSLSVWKSRHETHREDDPVFDWGWNGEILAAYFFTVLSPKPQCSDCFWYLYQSQSSLVLELKFFFSIFS